MELSSYQKNILYAVHSTQHLAIQARAGGGKSKMLELIAKELNQSFLLIAFNKHNAEEMTRRLPQGACSRTSHSIGKQLLGHKGPVTLDKSARLASILGYKRSSVLDFEHFWNYTRLLNTTDVTKVQEYCEFDVSIFADDINRIKEEALNLYLRYNLLDFTDMLWLPLQVECQKLKYDVVVGDEWHDVAPVAIEMVRQHLKPSVKTAVVYDDMQNIFQGLNGTYEDNGAYWSTIFKSKQFSLPISYRCPKAVVNEAQQYVPDIEHFKTGGTVQEMGGLPNDIPKGSLVISGHYEFILPEYIKRRIGGDRCVLRGHNFFEEALNTAKSVQGAKRCKSFRELAALAEDELKKKSAKVPFTLAGMQKKQHYNASISAIKALAQHFSSYEEAKKFAGQATKGNADYTFSSIHRCKGDESDNVFFLNYNKYEEEALAGDHSMLKLAYVGVTRAREKLFLC